MFFRPQSNFGIDMIKKFCISAALLLTGHDRLIGAISINRELNNVNRTSNKQSTQCLLPLPLLLLSLRTKLPLRSSSLRTNLSFAPAQLPKYHRKCCKF